MLNLHGWLNVICSAFDFFQDHWRRKRTVKVTLGFISGPSVRNKEDIGQRTQGQLHLSFAL